MDTTAVDIKFNEYGVCNYCTEFLERSGYLLNEDQKTKSARLETLVTSVKMNGKGKPYDCIVGVSGGVDSSYALVKVKRLGLRPLAVHMDNGWNSELAQNNISNLVQGLGVDLHTHVIDWEEYRSLMQSFFDADVIDVELLYDNAMLAVNYQQARKYGLKYILAGTNQATEGMHIPKEWVWFKNDKKQIKSLAKLNGIRKLNTFPAFGTKSFIWNHFARGIRWVSFLDYLNFNKFDALNNLEQEFSYKRYPYKHYESIFTRFYQGYILPNKFNVDKRKVHLSTLVASGQISREDAIKGLKGIPYPSQIDLEADITYFLKKMRWTRNQLQSYIDRPRIEHSFYPSEKQFWNFCKKIYFRLESLK